MPVPQQLPQVSILPARHPDPRKAIFQQQPQQQLRILAIRLLLAYPLASDLGGISDPQLKLQLRQQSLKPARVPTGFHPHAHLHSLCRESPIELLRSLAVLQSQLVQLSSFGIHKCNLLEGRVVICSLYLVCVCPIRSLCVSGVLDRVSAGGRSLLRRCCSAAWIIDRPPALLSQRRGESQAARACIQGRRERWHRVGEPKLSLIRFCRGSTCL